MDDTTRRRFLALTGTAVATPLAGCSSVFGEVGSGGDSTPTPSALTSADDERSESTPSGGRTSGDGTTSGDRGTDDGGADATDEPWSPDSVTIEPAATGLADVPVANRGARYPRMGTSGATTTATVFGNWKCPYTREFVLDGLPAIAEEFVAPGDLELEFRALSRLGDRPFLGPDAPRAGRAGLAVWNVAPTTFWHYAQTVFANQPRERHEWARTDLLVRFADAAEVDATGRIEREIERGRYESAVRATTDAAAERGISTVPRLVVDGEVTAPTVNPEASRATLRRAIGE